MPPTRGTSHLLFQKLGVAGVIVEAVDEDNDVHKAQRGQNAGKLGAAKADAVAVVLGGAAADVDGGKGHEQHVENKVEHEDKVVGLEAIAEVHVAQPLPVARGGGVKGQA